MKKCTRCHILQPFTNFSKASREKDGFQDRCKACNKIVSAEYRAAHKEKERLRHAKYHAENKEKINARISQWQKENRDKCNKKSRRFYELNREKELKRMKRWAEANPEWRAEYAKKFRAENKEYFQKYEYQYFIENKAKIYAKMARRRALKKHATVAWANHEKILEIYRQCVRLSEETGIEHHVDHIIPLTSKFICGLHVETNLQILTASENSSKLNKFIPYST